VRFLYENTDITQTIRNLLINNHMTINKILVSMGRILKFKNNGLNLKEPCLYENIILKRISIIFNFITELKKFDELVNQLL